MTDREERFTPGPWSWFGTAGSAPRIYLASRRSGRQYVMGFKRWGFNGAQPEFRLGHILEPSSELLKFVVGDKSVTGVKQAKGDPSVYRYDIRGIDAPDAHLIAAAPELYEALKESIVKLKEAGCGSKIVDQLEAVLSKARGEKL